VERERRKISFDWVDPFSNSLVESLWIKRLTEKFAREHVEMKNFVLDLRK
jgi:hypothetical protein